MEGVREAVEQDRKKQDRRWRPSKWQKALMLLAPSLVLALSLLMIGRHLFALSKAQLVPEPTESPAADLYLSTATPEPTPTPIPTPEPTPEPPPEPTPEPTSEPTMEPSPFGWREIDGLSYYLRPDGSAVTGLHVIDGKLCFFDPNGVKASALGVDVSFYNRGINWHMAKRQGLDYAIIRIGYRGWETGLLHEDSCFRQNLRGAKEAGIRVGVYFFSTAANASEAAEEASYILTLLNGFPLDYPVFLDIEDSGDYPNGRADKLCAVRRAEIAESFSRVIREGGYRPGIYSYQNFVKFNKLDHQILAPRTFWFASYTKPGKLPDFPWPYDMWQFTDHGAASGIRGVVDMNAVFG